MMVTVFLQEFAMASVGIARPQLQNRAPHVPPTAVAIRPEHVRFELQESVPAPITSSAMSLEIPQSTVQSARTSFRVQYREEAAEPVTAILEDVFLMRVVVVPVRVEKLACPRPPVASSAALLPARVLVDTMILAAGVIVLEAKLVELGDQDVMCACPMVVVGLHQRHPLHVSLAVVDHIVPLSGCQTVPSKAAPHAQVTPTASPHHRPVQGAVLVRVSVKAIVPVDSVPQGQRDVGGASGIRAGALVA